MTDRSSVPSRILGVRATQLGPGDSLENINTAPLDDGALCYVTSAHAHFELHRDSSATPDGVTVVAPSAGPGRWLESTGSGAALSFVTPNLTTLALLSGYPNGSAVYVIDQAETYRLDTGNTFAPHPTLVIARAAGAGTGRWFQRSKAYVVGNFTLWCGSYVSPVKGGIIGFTAGQLLASNTSPPDIVLDMHNQTNTTGNQQGVITDGLGNVWLLMNGDGFLSIHFYKYLLEDCLESGSPPLALTLTVPVATSSEAAVAAFDRNNALWAANGEHGTFGKSRFVRYGVRAYGSSLGTPGTDIVIDPAAGSTSNQQDLVFDGDGNLWCSVAFSSATPGTPNGGIFKLTLAQQQASSAGLEPAVFWHGSNFSASSLGGTCQLAVAPNGLLWAGNLPDGTLRAWNMSLPSGNPAPAITLTCATIATAYSLAFDLEGNLWVANDGPAFGGPFNIQRIPRASLAASGAVTADIIIEPGLAFGLGPKFTFPNNPDRVGLLPSGFPPD